MGWLNQRRISRMERACDVGALRGMLGASSSDTDRANAAMALGRLGVRDAADDLLAALETGGYWVQLGAIDALGSLGDERALRPAVETLWRNDFRLSESNDAELLDMLTDELARLPFAGMVGELSELLRHESGVVRLGAAQALGKLGDRRAEPSLRRVLGDRDELVSEEARTALETLGDPDDGSEP